MAEDRCRRSLLYALPVLDCPFVVLNAVYPLLYPGIIVSEQQHVRSATVCIVAAILGYQVVQYRRKSQVGLRGGFLWSHFTKYESTTTTPTTERRSK